MTGGGDVFVIYPMETKRLQFFTVLHGDADTMGRSQPVAERSALIAEGAAALFCAKLADDGDGG